MSTTTTFRTLAGAGVLALALTACGGGSDPLTKAEFIRRSLWALVQQPRRVRPKAIGLVGRK